MAELKGSFALGIMFKDFPDRVFAVRRESPLIVGVAEGECFIASDVPAFFSTQGIIIFLTMMNRNTFT